MLVTLVLSVCAGGQAGKPDAEKLVPDARTVLAAVVEAAKENRRRKKPIAGDELTAVYLKAAAAAARKLPDGRGGPAFALAVGVGLDTSALMRKNPVVAGTWRKVETDAERKARLEVLGEPTMHARHDLAQHFGVSMGLTAVLGEKRAESAGILKELLDAQDGGSGFSFADLAADFAGIALAKRVIDKPELLEGVEKGFAVKDYVPPPKGYAEGLTTAEFEKRYGGVRDERFRKARDEIVSRVQGLPGFTEKR